MKGLELKELLESFSPEVNRFARFAYRNIYSLYCDGHRGGVSFSLIYDRVRQEFFARKERRDPPFWSHYSDVRATHLLIEGLTALEQRGLIELNEETGRYKVLRK